ncbi:hypothetical protein SAMN04487920_15113 [Bacillus mycoides]|uniref:hypothetical protein n=1 Tax=Bacillus mycoides TaxID=1405 RepID=UPI0008E35D1F|nr:hypothetical protein [Bacillus mycoides]SFQ92658.1 hypothetical protein SAMN04487920_15113 [Bacillus mycoides]
MSVPIYKLDGLSLKAKYFLYILEENGDLEGTITRIADILETSRNRVHEVIDSIEETGYLEVERGSGRKPSIYRLKGVLKAPKVIEQATPKQSEEVKQDLLNEVKALLNEVQGTPKQTVDVNQFLMDSVQEIIHNVGDHNNTLLNENERLKEENKRLLAELNKERWGIKEDE